MKILILVLSYNRHPYDELMKAQQETWDSKHVEDVRTIYYYGGGVNEWEARPVGPFESRNYELKFDCTDAYYYMAHKLKRVLRHVRTWDYDFIFRTNSSSYVNKVMLKEAAKKLPLQKCYAGWEIKANEGFNIVSGAGIFMSRDVAAIVRGEIDPWFEKEEDYYIGQILAKHNIPIIDDKSRLDFPNIGNRPELAYHLRFKTQDRIFDADAMRNVHKKINQL